MRLPHAALLCIALAVGLAACDSAEERAERHFASAEALVAAGDVDRALVELRNVFRFDGSHREARWRYAELQLGRGERADAYGNLLRLVEFYPDDVEARLTLAELSLADRSWEEVERHGRAAMGLVPEQPRAQAIKLALDYRAALRREDAMTRSLLAAEARELLAVLPEALAARVVLIDHLMLENETEGALRELAVALDQAPERRDLHELKLRLLVRSGADEAAGAQLRRMFERYPDDRTLREAVVGWYVERGRQDEAAAFLREVAERAPEDVWPNMALAELVRRDQGAEAARAEIDQMIEAGGDALRLGQMRAELALAEDDPDRAVAELEALLAGAEEGAARNDLEVRLAQLLLARGEVAAARERVGAVLAADAGHVEALKLEAGWLTRDDRPGDALLALRQALTRAPGDAEIMALMAEAHQRDGSIDLAGERLALAVEVSGSAANESLRYASFLAQQGRLGPAEAVLETARRVNPGDLRLLVALGELWVQRGDPERAAAAVATLRATESAGARRAADALEATLLARQDRTDESVRTLEALLGDETFDMAAVGMILQARLEAGQAAEAAEWLDGLIALRPETAALRFLRAGLHVLEDETAAAEAVYRELIAERPEAEGPVVALHVLMQQQGRDGEAAELLAEGLAAQPQSVRLRWLQASAHEAAGDMEAAIAVYEELYAEDSSDMVFANNLASLLSTARDDAESLERAFALARRLRSSEVPAFRSTYGWIEHRRGNHSEALRHLTYAAETMPDSGRAQFRLGMTLAALERVTEARGALARALELGGLAEWQLEAAEAAVQELGPGAEMGQ